jgi:serine/threonine protein kinase
VDVRVFQRVSELFDAVVQLPPAERTAYLDVHCEDPAIRSEVHALLSHADAPIAAVDTRAVNAALHTSLTDTHDPDPQQIGPYRILRRLGQGGMGVVYLAEQEHPRREVALKLIRPGLAAPDVLKRFEHETQVLARLRHPGIAQLLEAGWAELEGRRTPYFAMEYAPGLPLTEYAHQHGLDIRQRVELIIRVCEAVQHAHQRGVIHRDLKPANILVTDELTEARTATGSRVTPSAVSGGSSSSYAWRAGPAPKVLDFGVARVTDADVKLTTIQTDLGQLIGTLTYMSPEQIDGDPLAIDTRSDVYTLGVILYELLAGSLPHSGVTVSLPERIRVLREAEPPRLSTLNRRLRGDLETIVHKALEKAPGRRYASAADLAADLQRFLRNEPIFARRPTLRYQVAKFAQRNRALVTGAALVLLALVGGALGTTWQAVRATRAQKHAAAAAVEAQRQQAIAAAVNEFLNELLTAADLEKPAGERDETIGQFLVRAEARIQSGSLRERPEVEADVRATLGRINKQLGRFEQAAAHLRRCLELRHELYGGAHPGVARAMAELGDILVGYSRFEEAEPHLRAALGIWQRVKGGRSLEAASAAGDLAQVLAARGDVDGATALNEEAVDILRELGPEQDTLRATLLNNQANVHRDHRNPAAAEPLYREALALTRERLGTEHIRTATFIGNLALTLKLLNRTAEAEPLYREALAIRRRLLPADHVDIAESLNNLSSLLGQTGRVEEAEPLAREALGILERSMPPGHLYVGYANRTLGNMLLRLQRYAEAEPHLLRAYEIFKAAPPQPADPTNKAAVLLAELYEKWVEVQPDASHAEAAARWRGLAAASQPRRVSD